MPTSITKNILILDQPAGELSGLAQAFIEECGDDGRVEIEPSLARALELIESDDPPDLVVIDYHLGDGARDGLAILAQLRAADRDLPVVMVAEKGDVETATRAIKAGASDFLVRGQNLSERVSTQLQKIKNLLGLIEKNRRLRQHNRNLQAALSARYQIFGRSPQTAAVLEKIERVAKVPRPVLITGERGVGKELVARAIHTAGGVGARPFVIVNCAAFTETLLESELFGHEKGAFTGADRRAPGKFEQAHGGALFLDEIGAMTLSFQQKVLRVVEYGTFTRVGGVREVEVNTRIIAATNADLVAMMDRGEFLRDLYDRLAFEIINVPPLRERVGDVELLANYFLEQFMREVPDFQGKQLSTAALDELRAYSFPGNVRELKNVIERAVYRDTTNELLPEDLGMPRDHGHATGGGSWKSQAESFQRRLVDDAMAEAAGNQAQAARILGLSYHQFRYYLRKYS